MAAVVQTGKFKEFPLTGSLTVVRPDKIHFNESQNLLESGTRTGVPSKDTLKATKHLMSSTFYNDLALLESEGAGGDLVSDITINGYPATKILGTSYISSIKNFMFVQVDPVAIITYTDLSVAEDTVVVDGVTFTAKAAPSGNFEYDVKTDGATQATEVAAVLDAAESNNLNRDDKFEMLKKDTAGISRNFKPSNRRIEIQVSQGDSEEMKSNWLSTDILFLVGVLLYDLARIVVRILSEDLEFYTR